MWSCQTVFPVLCHLTRAPVMGKDSRFSASWRWVSTIFFSIAVLVGVACYLTVVLIGISPPFNDAAHPFMCSLATRTSFVVKDPLYLLYTLKIGLSYLWVLRVLCVFWVKWLFHTILWLKEVKRRLSLQRLLCQRTYLHFWRLSFPPADSSHCLESFYCSWRDFL